MADKLDDLKGKAKEAAGSVTGDDKLKHEGKADQVVAAAKEKVGDAKNKVEDLAEKVKDKIHHNDK